ncbi:hypothetical protein NS115_23095 [Paenibacillus jamilae]|uniref:Uncharacterized protein n=2 Tax=Paenibacillus TaxID=44249 RepID=A0A0D5ZC01_PAEPS|nr:hypothetical protein RE92_16355 [Paenibacillus polymyxa]AKA44305.1 hypothetical protein PPSC2_20855 [Paenibacillus polymyxa SC2]AUO07310.1 hypothetical protein C0638_12610 [Paenibacillus sp. lzh-N1]KTS77946.1 hypothetical protein NS115_23095 [Paenibacillus jamilae]OAZ46753.1 hypothetical protein A9Z39_20155 [Paenibacillus polymyxa]
MKYSKHKIKEVFKSKLCCNETLKNYKEIMITVIVIAIIIIMLITLVFGTMHIIRDSIYTMRLS